MDVVLEGVLPVSPSMLLNTGCVYPTLSQALLTFKNFGSHFRPILQYLWAVLGRIFFLKILLFILFIRNISWYKSVFEVGNFLRDPPIAVTEFWVCVELCCRYLLNSRVYLLSFSFVPLPLGLPASDSAFGSLISCHSSSYSIRFSTHGSPK